MAGPIVFISKLAVVEGASEQFGAAYAAALDLIRDTKPRTSLMAAFTREASVEVRIVHAFPDAEAMATHFAGSVERTQRVAPVMRLAGFEVYGEAPVTAMDQLRREAEEAQVPLLVFDRIIRGFLR